MNGASILYTNSGTSKYNVVLTPQDYSDEVNITWTSSNPDVATIDQNGVVTPIKTGKTLIQATVIASYMNGTEKVNSLSTQLTQNVTIIDSDDIFKNS